MGVPVKPTNEAFGQRVPHIAGVPVDEVVLAAVGLVGDDHDVAPLGEGGVRVAFLFGEEFLNGREHHARDIHRELVAQVGSARSLGWRLAQEVLAAGEGAEELVVEVVAVGQHHDGRVVHSRLSYDGAGVEGHRQALAGTLRVPDHADPTVTGFSTRHPARFIMTFPHFGNLLTLKLGRAQGLVHRDAHRVELVIPRHLLDQRAAAVVLEHDEVADEREEPPRLEDALQHHLELGHMRVGQRLPGDGAPGLEPLPA